MPGSEIAIHVFPSHPFTNDAIFPLPKSIKYAAPMSVLSPYFPSRTSGSLYYTRNRIWNMCMRLIGVHDNRVRTTGPEILDREHVPNPLLARVCCILHICMWKQGSGWSFCRIDNGRLRLRWMGGVQGILMSAVGETLSHQEKGNRIAGWNFR